MSINRTQYYFILLLPFIEPQIFKIPGFELADKIFLLLKLMAAAAIIIEYMLKINISVSKYVVLMTGCQVVKLISTIINNGSVTRYSGPAINAVACIMIGELAFKSDWKKFFVYVENYLTVFFMLNSVTFILKIVGLYPYWGTFLGIENRWIYVLLPWTIIAFVNSYLKNKKISAHAWIIYFVSTLSLVIMWSAGAMISFLIIPVVFWFSKFIIKKKGIFRNIASRAMFLAVTFINFLLVYGIILDFLGPFIVKYLHKSTTLTGRTFLWDAVINVLNKNPLLGRGVQTHEYDMEFFYNSSGRLGGMAVNHPHNHLLNVADNGGFLALGFFVLVLYFVMRDVDRIRDNKLKRIFFTGALAIFTAALVDTLDFSLFYLLIPLAANLSHLEKKKNIMSLISNIKNCEIIAAKT
ncbi:MAG: O-antigen ligase family protein [Porcipelethomonas sp.]